MKTKLNAKLIAKITLQLVAGWYASSWASRTAGKLFDQYFGTDNTKKGK